MEWLWRPGSHCYLASCCLPPYIWCVRGKREGKEIPAEESEGTAVLWENCRPSFSPIFVLLVVAAALYEARSFPYLGAIFPMAATIPAIFMAAAQIVLECAPRARSPGIETRTKTKLALGYFLSLVAYLLLILLFGFGIATALFTFGFPLRLGQNGLVYALIYTGSVVGVTLLMSSAARHLLAGRYPARIMANSHIPSTFSLTGGGNAGAVRGDHGAARRRAGAGARKRDQRFSRRQQPPHPRHPLYAPGRPPNYVTGAYEEEEFWQDLRQVTGGATNERLARLTIRESEDSRRLDGRPTACAGKSRCAARFI